MRCSGEQETRRSKRLRLEAPQPVVLHSPECNGSPEDVVRMRTILRLHPEAVHQPQPWSLLPMLHVHPLYEAAWCCHLACVTLMLQFGANPNISDRANVNPLSLVYISGADETKVLPIVKLLMEKGTNPNFYSRRQLGNESLYLPTLGKWNKTVQVLLEAGANVEELVKNETGQYALRGELIEKMPILAAIFQRNTVALHLLLLHGAKWDFHDREFNKISLPILIFKYYKLRYKAIAALKVYRQFGGNMWVRCGISGRTALAELRRNPMKYKKRGRDDTALLKQLKRMMRKPLSLQSLSRNAIRAHLGRDHWRLVHKLPLPDSLISLLLYPELVPAPGN